jgi:capsular exopolysaccharide synthesis family protein
MEPYIEQNKEDSFDIRDFVEKYLGYWPWYLLFCFMGFCVAWFFTQKMPSVYEVKTTLLIKQERSMLDARFTAALGGLDNNFQVQNEMGIIKSRSLITKAIKSGNFRIGYFHDNLFTSCELYKDSPFVVEIDTAKPLPLNTMFYVKIISPSQFILSTKAPVNILENVNSGQSFLFKGTFDGSIQASIGQSLVNNGFNFKLSPNKCVDFKSFTDEQYSFVIYSNFALYQQMRSFMVSDIKMSSMLAITMRGNNVDKLCDFLNLLSQVYLEKGIEKKNLIAESTINFIDSQLGDVSDSLRTSETVLQSYKTTNQIMDVEYQSQQVYSALQKLQEQKAELIVKQRYYDYLLQYLAENNDGKNLIAPSSMGINEQMLNSFISELIDLYNERSELKFNSKKENVYLTSNEEKIKDLVNTIVENLKTLKKATDFSAQDIDKRLDELTSKVNVLPEKQRKLFGYERKFKLNDALYTYLLTKRSEIQIAKASYFPDNEILDKATSDEYTLVSPNKKKNYLVGILLGLVIPILFLVLRDYFNNKIQTTSDIEKITSFPVLGSIVNIKERIHTVTADLPNSLTAESFRALRTNIQFVASENKKHCMLVTSTGVGEGKSFFSMNLALSYALYNKKTILLNFDLRRPRVHEYLGVENKKGLSLVLSGNSHWQNNIISSGFENLDLLMAGPIPPNPMDLIGGEYTQMLFDDLKKQYDYIIIDTAPVGLVADALLLLKYSDVNLFLVRYNVTPKKALAQIMQSISQKGIRHFNMVLNDIRISKKYYSNNYNYQYGYPTESSKGIKKWLSTIKA